MVGDVMLDITRKLLRDFEDDTRQGVFYSDAMIRLALNLAQDAFVNYCLSENHEEYLTHLLKEVNLVAQSTAINGAIIENYLHVYGASIKDGDVYKPAKVYLGSEALAYYFVDHYACFIIENAVIIKKDGDYATEGKFAYYERPSYIGLTSLGDDSNPDFSYRSFDDNAYNDIIPRIAATILAQRDTVNQRTFKMMKETVEYTKLFPSQLVHLFKDFDFIPRGKK